MFKYIGSLKNVLPVLRINMHQVKRLPTNRWQSSDNTPHLIEEPIVDNPDVAIKKAKVPLNAMKMYAPVMKKSEKQSSKLNHDNHRLIVCYNDGIEDQFPYVWLRDNCQCSACYEPVAINRIVNMCEFSHDIMPVTTEVTDEGNYLIEWQDGHVSCFTEEWLKRRSFSDYARRRRGDRWRFEETLWGADMAKEFPKADFRAIMSDPYAQLDWLHNLAKFGFVLVQNVPVEEGHVPALQDLVAFQKLTHYGPGYTVEVRPNPSNVSHTHHRIGLHTDLTYYHHIPGTLFLHCITQHEGPGGETMLADGFYAAQKLKQQDPSSYKILAEIPGQFRDIGTDFKKFHKENRQPFLMHDSSGKLVRVNWSHFARDSYMDVHLDDVERVYEAMRAFDEILNSPHTVIKHKMQPGEMVTIVNMRVLHGRTELEGELSCRHLQCGYMDWDEVASKIRVLEAELGFRERAE